MTVYAHTPADYEAAVDAAVFGGAGGMVVPGEPIFVGTRLLPPVAMRYRLPAIFVDGVSVKAGGLIAFGFDQPVQWRNVGRYAARMLKGEKPADTPVLQAAEFRLIINLKAASALGMAGAAAVAATEWGLSQPYYGRGYYGGYGYGGYGTGGYHDAYAYPDAYGDAYAAYPDDYGDAYAANPGDYGGYAHRSYITGRPDANALSRCPLSGE
jgi:hypothetical protein